MRPNPPDDELYPLFVFGLVVLLLVSVCRFCCDPEWSNGYRDELIESIVGK